MIARRRRQFILNREAAMQVQTITRCITKKGDAEPLSFFNTGIEIKQFLSQKIDNVLVAEISGWTPVEAKMK